MARYVVRIDAAFTYELEADSAEEAQATAETRFENGNYGDNRVTETLVFNEDGVTIADDDDEPWSCPNCGNTDQDGSDVCVDCGQPMEVPNVQP